MIRPGRDEGHEKVESGFAVPHSAGTAKPRLPTPAHACDAHLHVIDPGFAPRGARLPSRMTFQDYRLLQARLGTTRAVPVQAKHHGTDPSCLLDALRQLGANGRGVAVVASDVSDAELSRLHVEGVRGLRFSVWNPVDSVTTIDMIEPLAARVTDLGWHVQIHMSASQIVDHADLLRRLPCTVVFDHMARLPPSQGSDHPAFGIVAGLVDKGRTWVKLSGAYLDTEEGPPDYADAAVIAQTWVRTAAERLVWGSDWPHVTETALKPDDAVLLDLLTFWAPRDRTLILVDNPARLYGFV